MSPGFYKFMADVLVVFHFSFVGFVLLGGLIVLRWRRAIWLHLPAVAWGIFVELSHRICPLTPLENRLRLLGGGATYQGSFVDHYIMPVLYPSGLTKNLQVAIACVIVVLNAVAYGWIVAREVRRRQQAQARGFLVTSGGGKGAGEQDSDGARDDPNEAGDAGAPRRAAPEVREPVAEVR